MNITSADLQEIEESIQGGITQAIYCDVELDIDESIKIIANLCIELDGERFYLATGEEIGLNIKHSKLGAIDILNIFTERSIILFKEAIKEKESSK